MQAKSLFEIMQTKCNDISYHSRKSVRISEFFNREAQQFGRVLSESEGCLQGGKEHWEFTAKRQQISVINNDERTYYHGLYCEIIDIVKGQLIIHFSEILELKFVSLLDFKQYSEKIPSSAYELLLMVFWFSSSEIWSFHCLFIGRICVK